MDLKNVVCLFVLFNVALSVSIEPKINNKLLALPINNSNISVSHTNSTQSHNNTHYNGTNTLITTNNASNIRPDFRKKPRRPVIPSIDKVPVIAILASPVSNGNNLESYIPSELIFWVTSGGAVPLPVEHWVSGKDLDHILQNTNGFIIQGTEKDINLKGDYEKFVTKLIKKVKALNDKKIYYPLFALGSTMKTLVAIESLDLTLLTQLDGLANYMTKLYFTGNPIKKKYRLFSSFERRDFISFMRKPTNFVNVHSAIDYANFNKNANMKKEYIVTSYGKNAQKKRYVVSVECNDYPIFGLLSHPYLVSFSRDSNLNIKYTQDAFSISQRFLNFIVEEGRKSQYTANIKHIYKDSNGIDILGSHPGGIVEGRKAWIFKNPHPLSKKKH